MRLNKAVKEKIRYYYIGGMPVWQIADILDLTIPQVTKVLGI